MTYYSTNISCPSNIVFWPYEVQNFIQMSKSKQNWKQMLVREGWKA